MSEIFIKLLNMSISAGWLVLCVAALRIVLKKAPKWIVCVLWAMVAVRLLCPFSLESALSLIPSAETVPEEIIYSDRPEIHTGIEYFNSTVNPIISEELAPSPVSVVNPMEIIATAASIVWIVGMAAMTVYSVVSYVSIRIKVSEAMEEDGIYICDRTNSPFILGFFKPRIILPSDIGKEDREYVIAHEKAHILRRDHIWKPLGFLLLTVYWFNPVMWVGYILLCRDIEAACDEKVIKKLGEGAKKPYANALINCSIQKRTITACPLAFGETDVKSRIKSVLSYKKPAFWMIVVAIIVSAVVAVCFLTDPSSIKSEGMNAFIEEQIIERYQHKSGEFCCTDFKILGTKKHKEDTTVYMWVLYQEYDEKNGNVDFVSGSHVPTAMTIRNENDTFSLIEYWEPRDGTYNAKDIAGKFPWYLIPKALDSQRYIKKQEANCLKKAEEYFSSRSDSSQKTDAPIIGPVIDSDAKIYLCQDSPDPILAPQISLSEKDKTFHLSVSALSSAYIAGTYELTEEELILTTYSEDPCYYVFRVIDENTLSFVAERSEKIPLYKYGEDEEPHSPVPDGAKFTRVLSKWEPTVSRIPVIDSIEHDINGDGYPESCTMTPGPTSGVNSIKLQIVDRKNETEYSDWWSIDYNVPSFWLDENDLLCISGERQTDYHTTYRRYEICIFDVALDGEKLCITERSRSDRGSFIRVSDVDDSIRYGCIAEAEQKKVAGRLLELFGDTNSDTGYKNTFVVAGIVELDGEQFYIIHLQWIVENKDGMPHHASTVSSYVASEDLTKLYDAYFEEDGILKIYDHHNISDDLS